MEEYHNKMNYFEFSSLIVGGGKMKLEINESSDSYSSNSYIKITRLYNDLITIIQITKKERKNSWEYKYIMNREIEIKVGGMRYSLVNKSDLKYIIRDIIKIYNKLNTLQKLKEKEQLVTSVGVGHLSLKDDSIIYISTVMKPENYKKVKEEIISQFNKLRTTEVTDEELNRAKNYWKDNFYIIQSQ